MMLPAGKLMLNKHLGLAGQHIDLSVEILGRITPRELMVSASTFLTGCRWPG